MYAGLLLAKAEDVDVVSNKVRSGKPVYSHILKWTDTVLIKRNGEDPIELQIREVSLHNTVWIRDYEWFILKMDSRKELTELADIHDKFEEKGVIPLNDFMEGLKDETNVADLEKIASNVLASPIVLAERKFLCVSFFKGEVRVHNASGKNVITAVLELVKAIQFFPNQVVTKETIEMEDEDLARLIIGWLERQDVPRMIVVDNTDNNDPVVIFPIAARTDEINPDILGYKYEMKCWIPAEPEEPISFVNKADADAEKDQAQLMQPENVYRVLQHIDLD